MVSTRAGKCPKCGCPVRLSMNPGPRETKQQSAEAHAARETENTVAIPNVLRIPDVPNAPDVPRTPAAPDVPDAPQPRRKGAKKEEVLLPSEPLAVAEDDGTAAASGSCVTEAWEFITLSGRMTDMNGTYPIELSFEKEGSTDTERHRFIMGRSGLSSTSFPLRRDS